MYLYEKQVNKQTLSFLGPKATTKISGSTKNVKAAAYFTHNLKWEFLCQFVCK